MSGRLQLDGAAIAQEIATLRARLGRAPKALEAAHGARPGATPREHVFTTEGARVYRYAAVGEATATPLLLVYALVNRPEMADLAPGRSLIEALTARGFTVFLIDWDAPTLFDRDRGLDDYILRYLDRCVDFVRTAANVAQVNLMGICQGGTFSVCYASLFAEKVARLITTVTPIDFHTPDDRLSHLVRGIDLEALVAAGGNVPGEALNALFLSLKPFRLTQQKYVHLLEQIDDPESVATFVRMERWIFDSPAVSARAALEFGRDFYQRNLLAKGELQIGNRPVRPQRLNMPILNLYAGGDHLVPPPASQALAALHGSQRYVEHELPGGHIGIYVSTRSPRSVPHVIGEWFAGEHVRA